MVLVMSGGGAASAAGGDLVLIGTTTLALANATITSPAIPACLYKQIRYCFEEKLTVGGGGIHINFNGAAPTSENYFNIAGAGHSASTGVYCDSATDCYACYVGNISNSGSPHIASGIGGMDNNYFFSFAWYNDPTELASIAFVSIGSTFKADTRLTIWGVKE